MHARCAARLDPEACELSIAEKLDAMEHGRPAMTTGWKWLSIAVFRSRLRAVVELWFFSALS